MQRLMRLQRMINGQVLKLLGTAIAKDYQLALHAHGMKSSINVHMN